MNLSVLDLKKILLRPKVCFLPNFFVSGKFLFPKRGKRSPWGVIIQRWLKILFVPHKCVVFLSEIPFRAFLNTRLCVEGKKAEGRQTKKISILFYFQCWLHFHFRAQIILRRNEFIYSSFFRHGFASGNKARILTLRLVLFLVL